MNPQDLEALSADAEGVDPQSIRSTTGIDAIAATDTTIGDITGELLPDVAEALEGLEGVDFKDLLKLLETPELPGYVKRQLLAYAEIIHSLKFNIFNNEKISKKEAAQNLALLILKCMHFINTRDTRVDEINSPEYREAKEIKAKLYPLGTPNLIVCLDWRVMPKVIVGLTGHAYRTPTGDSPEFVGADDGSGKLTLEEGEFTRMIDDYVKRELRNPNRDKRKPISLYELFDSHTHCAAKGKEVEESARGKVPDGGLYSDVDKKRKMVEAFERYVSRKYPYKIKGTDLPQVQAIGGQVSFDVSSGYIFMGLEKDECLDYGAKNGGYTEETRQHLVEKGEVLSTKSLAEDSLLSPIFQKYWFDVDYEKKYAPHSKKFFENVEKMCQESASSDTQSPLAIIMEKLVQIYPDLEGNDVLLKQKAVFVLSNAYNGYLFNHIVRHNEDTSEYTVEKRQYKYSHHDESAIAIIFSERGPYSNAHVFSNDPSDPGLYSSSIPLQEGLIRKFREEGMMSEYELVALFTMKLKRDADEDIATFKSRAKTVASATYNIARAAKERGDKPIFSDEVAEIIREFAKNPIPVFLYERLQENSNPKTIEILQSIDWSDLAKIDWMGMTDEYFKEYIERKIQGVTGYMEVSLDVFNKMNSMRQRSRNMYEGYGSPTAKNTVSGRLIPMWFLADEDRKTVAIIPFIVSGYAEPKIEPVDTDELEAKLTFAA